MALLLQGRGYNLRRGVHFRDGGTSACSHEGGTVVAVSLVFVSRVPRGVRPDQADRGGASLRAPGPAAERGPDEAQQRACAPRRRARRGEPTCALASAVASDEDWTRKKLRALYALCASGGVSVRLTLGYHPPASLEGGTDPLGTCSRPMGGGTINRGGTLNRT